MAWTPKGTRHCSPNLICQAIMNSYVKRCLQGKSGHKKSVLPKLCHDRRPITNTRCPVKCVVSGLSAIRGLLMISPSSRLPRRRVRGWRPGRDADAARDALPPDRYRELGDEGAQEDIRVVSEELRTKVLKVRSGLRPWSCWM